jgi:hypothetical protein
MAYHISISIAQRKSEYNGVLCGGLVKVLRYSVSPYCIFRHIICSRYLSR